MLPARYGLQPERRLPDTDSTFRSRIDSLGLATCPATTRGNEIGLGIANGRISAEVAEDAVGVSFLGSGGEEKVAVNFSAATTIASNPRYLSSLSVLKALEVVRMNESFHARNTNW